MAVRSIARAHAAPKLVASGLAAVYLTLSVTAASVGTLPGCGCAGIALHGLLVTVVDGATGEPICDATVVATAGNHTETLSPLGSGDSCVYTGATERPGTYTIEASSAGRTVSMANVVVDETGFCNHVVRREVTLTLPAAAGA